jgi:Ion channel/Pentapeptide repeats (8 copies)
MNITREEQHVIHENLARLVQGVEVWNNWRNQNREIDIDLRRVNLEGVNLEGINLKRLNLNRANLSGADLKFANLRFANLSGTNLSGANLRFAKLYDADLSGVNLSGAHLIEADFRSADLSGATLSGATLSGADLSGADLRRANLTDSRVSGVKWDIRKMRGKYMGIRGIDSSYGNALFKRIAADQDYLDTLENHWKGKWQTYLFKLWGLIDYGRSIERVVAIAFITIFLFGLTYSIFPGLLGLDCLPSAQGYSRHSWFTPFYFSIVTFTTLGFGDITPKNLASELIVSLEVILGYAVLGLLISVLADKVVRRS